MSGIVPHTAVLLVGRLMWNQVDTWPGPINLYWFIFCFSLSFSQPLFCLLDNHFSDCVLTVFSLFLSACKTLLNKKSDGVKVSSLTHEGFIDFTDSVSPTLPIFCCLPLLCHPNYCLLTFMSIMSIWKSSMLFKLSYLCALVLLL